MCFSLCVQIWVHSGEQVKCISLKYFEKYFNWSLRVCLVSASTLLYTLKARVESGRSWTDPVTPADGSAFRISADSRALKIPKNLVPHAPSRSQNSTSSCPLLLLVIKTIKFPGLCRWNFPFRDMLSSSFPFRYRRGHLCQDDFWNVLNDSPSSY